MRGKLSVALCIFRCGRIIPAHAGQTETHVVSGVKPTDHPRACGANGFGYRCERPIQGSSPRMRGKPPRRGGAGIIRRIIPAHAGQTTPPSRFPPTSTDHPRACGANRRVFDTVSKRHGSSPRMRGKPGPLASPRAASRIIPAHAGQTFPHNTRTSWCSDHPRACGANPLQMIVNSSPYGSSPRMRGKLGRLGLSLRCLRIIPAHAGQTASTHRLAPASADHPRACGANCLIALTVLIGYGSSPRMRGKPEREGGDVDPLRIIPAHAGQTHERDGE